MPCSLIVRVIVPAAAALSLAAQPAWARESLCWNADELPAAQLHAFHTTLMVAALRCRVERPDALGSYNAFVEARKSTIDAARTVVQARFIRDLGPEAGLTEFKNFDTEIANRASIAGSDGMPCDGVDTYARLGSSASQADLFTLARLNNPGVEVRSCETQTTLAVAGPAAMAAGAEAPGQAGPAPAATGTDTSAQAPVAGATPAVVHGQTGEAARPEMQQASQTQDIASAATPQASATGQTVAQDENAGADPAKALEEAARALAAAASSLRTASTPGH